MTFCSFCQRRGHTLQECYKKPQQSLKITKNFKKTTTYGKNGTIIIGLTRRPNKEQININSIDKTEIKITENKEGRENSKSTTNIKNQNAEIEIIKEIKCTKETKTKCKTQTATPGYKVLNFKEPEVKLRRITEAEIACNMRNKAIMYMNKNKKLEEEISKLIRNKEALNQRIQEQAKKIEEMAEEIHHLSNLQGRKNSRVPTPGILPYNHIRLNLFDPIE